MMANADHFPSLVTDGGIYPSGATASDPTASDPTAQDNLGLAITTPPPPPPTSQPQPDDSGYGSQASPAPAEGTQPSSGAAVATQVFDEPRVEDFAP